MGKKAWAVFAVIVIAIIGGMVYMSSQNRLDISDISRDAANKIIGAEDRNGQIDDHILGNKDAKIVLVEYADFQCPGCSTAAPAAKNVMNKYKDDVVLVFRNFPITSIHPNARSAAAVAEAAGLQGKFWEMHDLLFTNQSVWSNAQLQDRNDVFNNYAKQLGLDEEKFNKDVSSDEVTKKINFDVAIARTKEVTGTPAFFLNGEAIDHNNLEEEVKAAVEKEKESSKKDK